MPNKLELAALFCAFRYEQVEERVMGLRELLEGGDVSSAVSAAPQLLLNDVQTCLRPRMTRLVVALTVNQLEGSLDADKVMVLAIYAKYSGNDTYSQKCDNKMK